MPLWPLRNYPLRCQTPWSKGRFTAAKEGRGQNNFKTFAKGNLHHTADYSAPFPRRRLSQEFPKYSHVCWQAELCASWELFLPFGPHMDIECIFLLLFKTTSFLRNRYLRHMGSLKVILSVPGSETLSGQKYLPTWPKHDLGPSQLPSMSIDDKGICSIKSGRLEKKLKLHSISMFGRTDGCRCRNSLSIGY